VPYEVVEPPVPLDVDEWAGELHLLAAEPATLPSLASSLFWARLRTDLSWAAILAK
jgi:hypothetical protein